MFNDYLRTGGFLSAINHFDRVSGVPDAVSEVYERWITADFVKKGKDSRKLIEVLRVLHERLVSPVSYSKLAQETNGISTDTVIDYIHHLSRLGVVSILHAFNQNNRSAYPKKDKKFHFYDPFIFRVIARALAKKGVYISKAVDDSLLVEGVVSSTYADYGPAYYHRGKKEVDLVSVASLSPRYIEIKWSPTVRSEDISHSSKFPGSLVLSKQRNFGLSNGITFEPLIYHLLKLRE